MKIKILPIIFLLYACSNNNKTTDDHIGNFDISPDDNWILFSYYKNGSASLYTIDIDGKRLTKIIKSDQGKMYMNPRFSSDGKSMLFIKYLNSKFEKSTLCISKIDGTEVRELTDGSEIITEAIFSKDGKEILYCKAREYASHSPIGVKNAHNFDVYSINIFSKQERRLTNLDAYKVNSISEIDTTYVLLYIYADENSGMYSFEKRNPSLMKKIVPVNIPREENLFSNPAYSSSGIMVFTAPYELYSMRLEDRKAKLIYDSKGDSPIQTIRLFKTKPLVIFKKESDNSRLILVSISGDDIKVVNINIED